LEQFKQSLEHLLQQPDPIPNNWLTDNLDFYKTNTRILNFSLQSLEQSVQQQSATLDLLPTNTQSTSGSTKTKSDTMIWEPPYSKTTNGSPVQQSVFVEAETDHEGPVNSLKMDSLLHIPSRIGPPKYPSVRPINHIQFQSEPFIEFIEAVEFTKKKEFTLLRLTR